MIIQYSLLGAKMVSQMLANLKPLSLFKEGLPNRISISCFMWHLNVFLSMARTFVLLESTECP